MPEHETDTWRTRQETKEKETAAKLTETKFTCLWFERLKMTKQMDL